MHETLIREMIMEKLKKVTKKEKVIMGG